MNNNFATIEELLIAPEGESVQFKEAKSRFDYTEAIKICCALANCGGGQFVLGITDKRPRKIVGSNAFEQPERTRKGLIDKLHVMVDFQLFESDGKRVLVFNVASRPAGLPVQADGVAWWYEADSLMPMPQEILHQIYEETGHDFSSDICPGAGMDDLDETAIETFRQLWKDKSGNKRIANLSAEQLLKDAGAIDEGGITYAALILFGSSKALRKHLPHSEVIFEYRSFEAAGPAAQREEFLLGYFAFYNRIWELINLRNDKQHYQEGMVVYDIPTFNEQVVREAVLNAVSHRNYQLGGSIFVRQYNDRLEIDNPGGFPFGITASNILNRQNARNHAIARIFSLCGLVERAGQGMNLIYELSVREAKELPDFHKSDEYFVCLILKGRLLDKEFPKVIRKIGAERSASFSTDDYLAVYNLYFNNQLSKEQVSRLDNLIDMQILQKNSKGEIVFAVDIYEPNYRISADLPPVATREEYKEKLLLFIREKGNKGTRFKELKQLVPDSNRGKVQVLLRSLQKNELIYSNGKGGAAKWFPAE